MKFDKAFILQYVTSRLIFSISNLKIIVESINQALSKIAFKCIFLIFLT